MRGNKLFILLVLLSLFYISSLAQDLREAGKKITEEEMAKIESEQSDKIFSFVITMINGQPNVLFNKKMISLSEFMDNYSTSQNSDRKIIIFGKKLSLGDLKRISIPSQEVLEAELRKFQPIEGE